MSFLQIASWNVEHLRGGPRKDRPQSAFALTDHIEMAGIDLLALQEVYVTDPDAEVVLGEGQPPVPNASVDGIGRNDALDMVCRLLDEHLQQTWRYQILANRPERGTNLHCAVLWNTARLSLQSVLALPVQHQIDGDWLWDRTPHVLRFTSEVEVWRRVSDGTWEHGPETRTLSMVPLHMKSNSGGPTPNRRKRSKEAKTLCEALKTTEDQIDETLVLLGDTNILRNDEPAIESFIDYGLVDLNNNDAATYWSRQYGESPFDRILVRRGRKEFRHTRQYVLRSSDLAAHDRLLSDHYMIKASIKHYVDDADPRESIA